VRLNARVGIEPVFGEWSQLVFSDLYFIALNFTTRLIGPELPEGVSPQGRIDGNKQSVESGLVSRKPQF
jgi:hypothetical protein